MAVSSIISRVCDLNKPLVMESLDHLLVMGDDKGDQFNISVTNGSEPKDLLTSSVLGYFIKLESGKKIEDCETVMMFGSSNANVATIILPESCYTVPCRFVLTIKVSLENTRHAVYVAEGAVARSSTAKIIDPGHEIPDIEELLALVAKIEGSINSANEGAQRANTAAGTANSAASNANAAAENANAAAQNADIWAKATASLTVLGENDSARVETIKSSNSVSIHFYLPRGYTGLTPNLRVGSVALGASITDANVTITGTAENPVLNFILPKRSELVLASDIPGVRAVNLLDNSDFLHPVNQRGVKSWTGVSWAHSLDRWVFGSSASATFTGYVDNRGLVISPNSGTGSVSQRFEKGTLDAGKSYTCAQCEASGRVTVVPHEIATANEKYDYVNIFLQTRDSHIIWLALYEGSYTADTIPIYQPRGYGAELYECRRYYRRYGYFSAGGATTANGTSFIFNLDYAEMRDTPTVTYALQGLYVGGTAYTTISSLSLSALPSEEAIVGIGQAVARNEGGAIRFSSLVLDADL